MSEAPKKDDLVISAKGLSVGYGPNVIWQDASFSVRRGEFIGLLGPNGSGKTTLFRLLLGLTKPLTGSIKILDEELRRGNPKIGYVPQRRLLDSESRLHALEYVILGIDGNKYGISLFRAKANRNEAIEALRLVDGLAFAYKPLSELSGGELQKVYLAQALVGQPELLLLDEPLANLDIRRSNEQIRLIKTITEKNNIAVLLIAHDINPLLPVVDRIIYIANKKVVSGSIDQVISSERLSNLYNSPIEVLKDSKGRLAVLGVEEAIHHDE